MFRELTDDVDETSIVLQTRHLGLKRGDFCRVVSGTPALKTGSEVMVSTVYKDLRNVDVIDYNHIYHKLSEFSLRKI